MFQKHHISNYTVFLTLQSSLISHIYLNITGVKRGKMKS